MVGQLVVRGYLSESNSKEETFPNGCGLASEVEERTAETRESRGATSNEGPRGHSPANMRPLKREQSAQLHTRRKATTPVDNIVSREGAALIITTNGPGFICSKNAPRDKRGVPRRLCDEETESGSVLSNRSSLCLHYALNRNVAGALSEPIASADIRS
jgi:hypothetical protein